MDEATIIEHLTAVKRYTTGSYAFALYEYAITFDREVETFWKRSFTFPTLLWFLNRYTLYFSLFPTLMGFHVRLTNEWPLSELMLSRCVHFVKFPGVMQIVSNIASGLTLSLRVYALYGQARWVIAVLLPAFLAEIGLESWAVAQGVPAILPPDQVGCILTGRPDHGDRFAAFWIGQLVFPTLIFIMTLTRALRLRRQGLKGGILSVMLRDGVMYFLVIFVANLANVLTYTLAPEDLKFSNAPFTNVITTLMICRLMLNLKREKSPVPNRSEIPSLHVQRTVVTPRRAYFGNIAEDIDIGDESFGSGNRKTGVMPVDAAYAQKWVEEETDVELDLFGTQR